MKKLGKLFACLLVLTMALTGCGNNVSNADRNTANENKQVQNEKEDKVESQYPMTVKDSLGAEMTFDSKPERVISMTLGTDEMLLSLLDKENITALSGSITLDEGISNISHVAGDYEKVEGNIELAISMNPDLVFMADWTAKEKIQQLRDSGIKVYCYSTASSIEAQKKVVEDIAKVVGEEENGKKIIEEIDSVVARVQDKIGDVKNEDKPRVLFYNTFGTTNGAGTSFDDIVAKAGCVNIVSEKGMDGWPQVSKETIIEWNPDVIIVPAWSFDKNDNPQDFADSIINDESFSELKAIKNDMVIMVPDKHLNSVSQFMVYAIEDIAKLVYPDKF